METEEAIEGGARIRKQNEIAAKDDKHLAHDSVVAYAGLTQQSPRPYEETPLLSRVDTRHSASEDGEEEEGGEGGMPPRGLDWSNGDFNHLAWWRRPAIYWIVPPFLISALAFGSIVVTKLNLISDLICQQYFTDQAMKNPAFSFMPIVLGQDNPQCETPEVSALVSEFTLAGNLLSGLFAAVIAPLLGAYSDRHGRTKVIALTSLGTLSGEVITIVVARNYQTVSVYWILLGYALDGLCGSFLAGMAVSNAYASDCTKPETRARAFALFYACFFTGIAFGPLLAEQIVKYTGDILNAFYGAIGAHVFFVLYMISIVPESLSKRHQLEARERWHSSQLTAEREASWGNSPSLFSHLFKTNRFLKALKILQPTGPGSSRSLRRNLFLLAAIDTLCFGVAMGSMTVVIIYSKLAFSWGIIWTSRFVSIVSVCRVFALVVILPLLSRILRGRTDPAKAHRHTGANNFDLGIIRVAILFDLLGYVGYTVSGIMSSGELFIFSGCLAATGGMVSPILQSALTRHIPPDRTGQLLGAVALLHAIARIVAPTLFNGLYALTVQDFPQTVFVCLASAFLLAELLSWFVRPHIYLHESGSSESRPGTSNEIERDEDFIQVG